MTIQKIIEFLRSVGEERAAEKLRNYYITRQGVFKMSSGHKRVLLLLFALGTRTKPLQVPLQYTRKGKQYNPKKVFWQSIEWLLERSSNSFKARFQELKERTNWVGSDKKGQYYITEQGLFVARDLLRRDDESREFFKQLRSKLHFQNKGRASFLKRVLIETDNFNILSLKQFNMLLAYKEVVE